MRSVGEGVRSEGGVRGTGEVAERGWRSERGREGGRGEWREREWKKKREIVIRLEKSKRKGGSERAMKEVMSEYYLR